MRTLLIVVFSWLTASAAHAQASACEPLPGVEALWAKPQTRFVIVGEYHGSSETPALFAEVVCQARRSGRPVKVGLEFEETEQARLDAFMDSEARTVAFANASDDGRRSEAMVRLMQRLRELKRSGHDLEVFAFRRSGVRGPSQTPSEQAMAASWREQAIADPKAIVLALVGNIHALKSPKPLQLPFTPAAAFLPAESTVSVLTTLPGGQIWACRSLSGDCRPGPLAPYGRQLPRGVHLRPEPGMDGRFSVGQPFTASPPAKQAQTN